MTSTVKHRAIITIEIDVETQFIDDPATIDMPAYSHFLSQYDEKSVIKEVSTKLREFIEDNHESICPNQH